MRTICFRVDANAEIGQGHAMRCLTIAKRICQKKRAVCVFLAADQKTALFFENSGFDCLCLETDFRDYSDKAAFRLREKLSALQADLLVVDSYFVTGGFLAEMRKHLKTACFFCREEKIPVDLLINYNVNFNGVFYEKQYKDNRTRLLLGGRYIPLRPEFGEKKEYRENKPVQSVLVLTGGSDEQGIILNFLKRIQQIEGYGTISFTCMIGSYSGGREAALQECARQGLLNVRILRHTPFIADLMKMQDLVISAGGTTVYELCALGIPSVIYALAGNQVSEAVWLQQNGILPYAGYCKEDMFWEKLFCYINEMIKDPLLRKQTSSRMSGLADGKGADRIADELWNLTEGGNAS